MDTALLLAAHGIGVGSRKSDYKKELLVSASRMRRDDPKAQNTYTDPILAIDKTRVATYRSNAVSTVDIYLHETKQLVCSINLVAVYGSGCYPELASIISGGFVGNYLVLNVYYPTGPNRYLGVFNATTGTWVRTLSNNQGRFEDFKNDPSDGSLYTNSYSYIKKIDTNGNEVWNTAINSSEGGNVIAGFEDGNVYSGHNTNGKMSWYDKVTGLKKGERAVTPSSTQNVETMRKFGTEYFVGYSNEYKVFTDNTFATLARTVTNVAMFYKISDTEMLVCSWSGTAGCGEMYTVNPVNFNIINPCVSAFNIDQQPHYEEIGKLIITRYSLGGGYILQGNSLVKIHLKG